MAFQYGTGLRNNQVSQIQVATGGVAWTASTPYLINTLAYNGAVYYQVTTGGTSASSGGPSGTGTGITDGSVTWKSVVPTLVIYSGAEPGNCAASNPTGVLATINLPAPFLTSASGVTTLAGTWSVASAAASGTAASFRIFDGQSSPVCTVQGNVTSDLVLNNTSIASGQTVSVTSFAVTAGNA